MAVIRLCSVPGCGQPHKTRGYCTRHYQLWRRNGDPLNPKARFFPGVSLPEKMAMFTTITDDGCWIWNDLRTPGGYGVVSDKGRTEFAHRAAWRLANGDIPNGMVVSHLCHCPACVRLDHRNASSIALAQQYGVSPSLIRQIRRRDIWKHLE